MSKWTYNGYRATLLRDGKFFALVTPDGRDRLSDQDAADLLAELNAEKARPDQETRIPDSRTTSNLNERNLMPCDGPSKDYAHKRADEVCDGIIKMLESAAYLREPTVPGLKEDHAKAKTQLREALRELFWIEACDSF